MTPTRTTQAKITLPRAVGEPESPTAEMVPSSLTEAFYYWEILNAWWRRMALASVVLFVVTHEVIRFLMTPVYRAEAVIRPASQQTGSGLDLTSLISGASSLGGALGGVLGASLPPNDVNEQTAILSSYQFNIWLAERYDLRPILMPERSSPSWLPNWLKLPSFGSSGYVRSTQWPLYKAMIGRFSCAFDEKVGNMTLEFVDEVPDQAERVLGIYIKGLRERLRDRAVQAYGGAIKALEEEVAKTSDVLLRQQLDQIIAQQLQQLKTAQAQADFAFTVIEPPVVPDRPYRPRPFFDGVLAAIMTPILMFGGILVSHRFRRFRLEYERATRAASE